MHAIEESLEIEVSVRTAYDQWTQFEQFPNFMEGIKEVLQLDDRRLAWRAEVMGKAVSWNAEITEQVPDQRISWRSTTGPINNGTILFMPLGDMQTKLTLRLEFEPGGAAETAGSALGLVTVRVKGDLKRFKKFIEERGVATGRWRGEIHGGQVTPDPAASQTRAAGY